MVKKAIRPFHERPRLEQFFSNGDMQLEALREAIANIVTPEQKHRIDAEYGNVIRKWQRELADDKLKHPEEYPDDNDYDGNYYGSTT